MFVVQRAWGLMFEPVQDDEVGVVVEVGFQEVQASDPVLVRLALRDEFLGCGR
ncbi:hypothetical protein SSPO_001450 [Streptomyces antimycoticus]|uniref:Uncharacterized protein n=1 Tax=Streptomyces antimycoticus TaxID=68175 RepID=A0A499UU77_9ACTN|nr:hypothetical protein [Streptomyces antimycoticus]BBJ37427.1 hypothetical protein SSPO_001450 [Streptomyces antimycoticus]